MLGELELALAAEADQTVDVNGSPQELQQAVAEPQGAAPSGESQADSDTDVSVGEPAPEGAQPAEVLDRENSVITLKIPEPSEPATADSTDLANIA